MKKSDKSLISDDSDTACEDIAVADAAADEEDSDLEEHSLGESDYSSVFL
jgi:hypothetical protein